MMRIFRNIAVIGVMLLMGCISRGTSQSDTEKSEVQSPRHMKCSFNPAEITSYEEYRTAIEHYWDDFDFEAGANVAEYDKDFIAQLFVDYVIYIEPEHADTLLRTLMQRASASREVFDLFYEISEIVLHDPNSPLRNDEYYIPILECVIASPLFDEYEKIAPRYDLDIALKNRIGRVATNFEYTLADGRTGWLHDIDADYTILMFSNPDCPMCREIMNLITSSPLLNELTERGTLTTISIYPDEDIKAWRRYLPNMPHRWICGYDKEMALTTQRLYNLNAIPSLYLLDKEKRVLIKDGTNVAHIENVIAYDAAK